MTGSELRTVMSFEDGLNAGDTVIARWTNSGYQFEARAEVVKNNRGSVRIKLLEEAGWRGGHLYPAGQTLSIQKFFCGNSVNLRWSCNNRIEPVGGYQEVAA